jgi:hypothetical protein
MFKTRLRCGRVELPSCTCCRRYAALCAVLQECRDEGDHRADARRSEVPPATTAAIRTCWVCTVWLLDARLRRARDDAKPTCMYGARIRAQHTCTYACEDPYSEDASKARHKSSSSSSVTSSTGSSLHQPLQQLYVIKLHGVTKKSYQPCKCDCDDTMRRSTPTRRTTQAGMADIPAMLYRLMHQ